MKETNNEMSSLRMRLKTVTKPMHDELENTELAGLLASGTIGKKLYVKYLQKLYSIHNTLEVKMQNMPQWKEYGIDIFQRSRRELILQDLASLSATPLSDEADVELKVSLNFYTAIGVLYVLEGSTMGGRILSQRLAGIKGDDGISVTRYFEAYKDNTLGLWSEYCSFLDAVDIKHNEKNNEIILGACDMFLLMREVMHGLT